MDRKIRSVIIVLLVIVYFSYIPNGFVWLDHGDIELKRSILPLLNITDAIFLRYAETGFYRPVVTVINSIDYSIYGLWPPGYHITSIFLHIITALTVPMFLSIFFNHNRREKIFYC